jgi:hypothetical protein
MEMGPQPLLLLPLLVPQVVLHRLSPEPDLL